MNKFEMGSMETPQTPKEETKTPEEIEAIETMREEYEKEAKKRAKEVNKLRDFSDKILGREKTSPMDIMQGDAEREDEAREYKKKIIDQCEGNIGAMRVLMDILFTKGSTIFDRTAPNLGRGEEISKKFTDECKGKLSHLLERYYKEPKKEYRE